MKQTFLENNFDGPKTKGMNFQKNFKGGSHFQSKNLCCRFCTLQNYKQIEAFQATVVGIGQEQNYCLVLFSLLSIFDRIRSKLSCECRERASVRTQRPGFAPCFLPPSSYFSHDLSDLIFLLK